MVKLQDFSFVARSQKSKFGTPEPHSPFVFAYRYIIDKTTDSTTLDNIFLFSHLCSDDQSTVCIINQSHGFGRQYNSGKAGDVDCKSVSSNGV